MKKRGITKKSIRKISRTNPTCLTNTSSNTSSKCIHSKVYSPESDFSNGSAKEIKVFNIISPLRTILNTSQPTTPNKEPILCEYIKLKDKNKLKDFKLYKESEVPLFKLKMTKAKLNELGYDNDYETDNEQIENAIKATQKNIKRDLEQHRIRARYVRNLTRRELYKS